MQDQDAPPVEEGETGGGVGVVRAAQIQEAAVVEDQAAINSTAGSTALPWTIAIGQRWEAATMGPGQDGNGQDFRPAIPNQNLIPCQSAKTRIPGSSALWMTFSSRQRFRKRRAN